jgi:heme/copper-type cytochrome/quinol oxidase subunit 2
MNLRKNPTRWIVLLAAVVGILVVPVPRTHAEPQERVVRIDASQYRFEPGVVKVNPGDRVTFEVRSTDVVHGIYLDGYDLSVTADPGQTATLSFVADRGGSFRFRCSVACGDLHPFMTGKLRVGTNWLWFRALALSLAVVLWAFLFNVGARGPRAAQVSAS